MDVLCQHQTTERGRATFIRFCTLPLIAGTEVWRVWEFPTKFYQSPRKGTPCDLYCPVLDHSACFEPEGRAEESWKEMNRLRGESDALCLILPFEDLEGRVRSSERSPGMVTILIRQALLHVAPCWIYAARLHMPMKQMLVFSKHSKQAKLKDNKYFPRVRESGKSRIWTQI